MGPASAIAIFVGFIILSTIIDVLSRLARQAQEEARRRQAEGQAHDGADAPPAPAPPAPRDELEAFLRRLVDLGEAAPGAAPPPAAPPPKRVVLRAKPVDPARPARPARAERIEDRHLEASVERRHLHAAVEDRHLETHVGGTADDAARAGAPAGRPAGPALLQRVERLPLGARSLVLAELFGPPPGLRARGPRRGPPPRPRPSTATTLDGEPR